jgi:UrcA family protein
MQARIIIDQGDGIMGKMNRKSWLSSLLLLGIAIPAIGMAATPSRIVSETIKISYADLNIETETGAKVLYARLKWASAQVCGIESFTTVRSLSVRRNALNCFQETLEASVEKIDSDALTRAHSG